MGTGVYVKPGNPSALDVGGGGGGFAGGRGTSWQPSTVNLRPVNPTRANARIGGRAVTPNSGRSNLRGFNNRAPTPRRGFGVPTAPANTTTRPFTGGPGGRGGRSTGFGELLKAAGTPRAQSRPAQGFGRTAGNAPLRPAPRSIPIDTPTAGAKRPFDIRAPRAGHRGQGLRAVSPFARLPGNPFAARPTPFEALGLPSLPRLPYPNEFPVSGLEPGRVITPEIPNTFTGGQSPGVRYRVTYQYNTILTNGQTNEPPSQQTAGGTVGYAGPIVRAEGVGSPAFQTIRLVYSGGAEQAQIRPGNCAQGCYRNIKIVSVTRVDGLPDTGGNPAPIQAGVRLPNPSRPTTPIKLPGADPADSPEPRPRPRFTNPGQPAKQPLPYISPDPVPLAPGDGPLPATMQPRPDSDPAPSKQPVREADKRPFKRPGPKTSPFSPQVAFAVGVALGRSLSATAARAINSTDSEGVKELIKTGIQLRTGQARPATTPISGINGSNQPVPIVEIIKEVVPTAPPESFEKCPPTSGSECKYDSLGIAGKCDGIKSLLDKNLDRNYTGNLELLPCEDDEPPETVSLSASDKGLVGIDAKLTILATALNMVWEKVKCDKQPLISMTEAWEIKKELNTPQLVVITKKPNDKTSFRRNFSIPHPSITTEEQARAIFATRRTYERGNKLVTLTLKDNSKIKLNVDSDATGQDLMDWLVNNCLDQSYQDTPPGQYRITTNAGREIIPCQVEIYSIAFYSEGKKGEMPQWQFIIPN